MDSLGTDPVVPETLNEAYMPFLLELTHSNLPLGGEPLDIMEFDINPWSSTMEESSANAMQSESSIVSVLTHTSELALNLLLDQNMEFQVPLGHIDQLEEYHTNNNPTNPMPTSSTSAASPSAQLPLLEVPSINAYAPMIRSEHQSYRCSWHLHDSGVQCDHVALDRPEFLRHLAEKHQVSGDSDATIICRLLDSKTGSACNTQIKRGNFARHVDTHYRLRYHCQYCPAGKSFSRQDSWRKHIRSGHS